MYTGRPRVRCRCCGLKQKNRPGGALGIISRILVAGPVRNIRTVPCQGMLQHRASVGCKRISALPWSTSFSSSSSILWPWWMLLSFCFLLHSLATIFFPLPPSWVRCSAVPCGGSILEAVSSTGQPLASSHRGCPAAPHTTNTLPGTPCTALYKVNDKLSKVLYSSGLLQNS